MLCCLRRGFGLACGRFGGACTLCVCRVWVVAVWQATAIRRRLLLELRRPSIACIAHVPTHWRGLGASQLGIVVSCA